MTGDFVVVACANHTGVCRQPVTQQRASETRLAGNKEIVHQPEHFFARQNDVPYQQPDNAGEAEREIRREVEQDRLSARDSGNSPNEIIKREDFRTRRVLNKAVFALTCFQHELGHILYEDGQLPLVARIVNAMGLNLKKLGACYWGMDEWILDGKPVTREHPLSFDRCVNAMCFSRMEKSLRPNAEQINFPTRDLKAFGESFNTVRCALMQGGQGEIKHWAFRTYPKTS